LPGETDEAERTSDDDDDDTAENSPRPDEDQP